MSSAVDVRAISKAYGRTVALRAVTLRIDGAQVVALLGPNGSGKTTLLKILAGVVRPSFGTMSLLGRNALADRLSLRGRIAFMSSDTYLYDDLTAMENLRFILTMAGLSHGEAECREALEAVKLTSVSSARIRSFSSGMKQRLALARTLLLHADIWLLDEPYNALDVGGADLVDEAIRTARSRGATVVIATHEQQRVSMLADSIAILERGVLTETSSAQFQRTGASYRVG